MGLNKKAHAFVAMQFEKRTTQKSYVARVWGQMKDDSGHVDMPIYTDWERRLAPARRLGKWPPGANRLVMAREDNATRVRLYPRTGRTHQLRVHMMMLGHVIIGDEFYAEGPRVSRRIACNCTPRNYPSCTRTRRCISFCRARSRYFLVAVFQIADHGPCVGIKDNIKNLIRGHDAHFPNGLAAEILIKIGIDRKWLSIKPALDTASARVILAPASMAVSFLWSSL